MTAETATRTIARFTITVPWELPTANSRLHWSKRAQQTKRARDAVSLMARYERARLGIEPNASERRILDLTLIRGKSQRILDYDNAVAALKPCVDGLVDAGWLAKDNGVWLVEYRAAQRKDNGVGPALEVEIGVPA